MLDLSQNDIISPPKLSVTLPVTVCDCLQLYNTTGPGSFELINTQQSHRQVTLWSCHIPLWSIEISRQSGVKRRNRQPQDSSDIPAHYLHPNPGWQFILRQCSPHTLFLIGSLSEILFSKSFHIHVPDWLYCVGEWDGWSYRCWHAAALLLAFPLRRAWLSSWPRWHADNPTDWRQQQGEEALFQYIPHTRGNMAPRLLYTLRWNIASI